MDQFLVRTRLEIRLGELQFFLRCLQFPQFSSISHVVGDLVCGASLQLEIGSLKKAGSYVGLLNTYVRLLVSHPVFRDVESLEAPLKKAFDYDKINVHNMVGCGYFPCLSVVGDSCFYVKGSYKFFKNNSSKPFSL